MSKPPRDFIPSAHQVYFLSIGCSQGKSIFQSERMAILLLDTLSGYRAQGKFQLHEFAVMPNHVHLLVTPGREVTLERVVQFIKGGLSFRAGKELGFKGEIWQRGYVDHRIRDFGDYVSHREYIHMNPVRAHLCESAAAFAYGSANPVRLLDAAPQGLEHFHKSCSVFGVKKEALAVGGGNGLQGSVAGLEQFTVRTGSLAAQDLLYLAPHIFDGVEVW